MRGRSLTRYRLPKFCVIALMLSACTALQTRESPPESCRDLSPPPQMIPFQTEREGAPPELVCFDEPNARALLASLVAAIEYGERAYTLCGPEPDGDR